MKTPSSMNSVSSATWQDFKKWWVKEGHERDPNAIELHEHNPLIEAASSVSDAVIVTIDMKAMRYNYISPNFDSFTGWNRPDYVLNSVEYVYSTMLPEDREGLVRFSELINSHFARLDVQQIKTYRFLWDQHISSVRLGYFRILQQCNTLKHDGAGNMEEILSFATKVENLPEGSQRLRITDGMSLDLFFKYDHKTKTLSELKPLTTRELEIAKLIARSITFKEISTKLNISFNTVKNHSSHMMEKLQVTNSIEMINVLKIWGFI
jgi:DNA-binding CsgD family transcriptional regulator